MKALRKRCRRTLGEFNGTRDSREVESFYSAVLWGAVDGREPTLSISNTENE